MTPSERESPFVTIWEAYAFVIGIGVGLLAAILMRILK